MVSAVGTVYLMNLTAVFTDRQDSEYALNRCEIFARSNHTGITYIAGAESQGSELTFSPVCEALEPTR